MATAPESLPGIRQGQEYLGLTLKQIAQAVSADESTLHRWRSGIKPSPVFLARLQALDELVAEMKVAFPNESLARQWLERELPNRYGQKPLDLILAGRSELVAGMLYSLNAGVSV